MAKKLVHIALVGNPNSGKTSLFNALTGMNQKVGNFPGVTVDKKTASDEMLRVMNRNYFDKVALSQIPPYITVFAKWGAVNQVRSEVILVKGEKACYVFSIFTKNNKDQKWTADNEAWVLTRKISKLLWEYFEPGDKWEPPTDAEKFY